jgi:hypothetical protein
MSYKIGAIFEVDDTHFGIWGGLFWKHDVLVGKRDVEIS